jgi:cytochrome c
MLKSRLVFFALAVAFCGTASAADAEAAMALMRQNNCLKCHHMEKEKEAPPFKKIAGKFQGKADAEAKLVTHLTTSPKVKLKDGTEEEHKVIQTKPAKDMAQVKNLVQFILSQPVK